MRTFILLLALSASPAPKWYVPPSHHFNVRQCRTWLRTHGAAPAAGGYCAWYGGMDLSDHCGKGYHMERQRACYGFGAAEISTVRNVCHLDVDRGSKDPCGLECAWSEQ